MSEEYSQPNRSRRWAFIAALQAILPALLIGIYLLIASNSWARLFRDYGLAQHKTSVVRIVSMAHNAILPYIEDIRQGKLTEEEGLARVHDLLYTMTYKDDAGDNYIFLISDKGLGLVHPFEPNLEGANRWDEHDEHGKYYIRELIQAALSSPQGGFVTYYYPVPNSRILQHKISYVISIPERKILRKFQTAPGMSPDPVMEIAAK